MNVLFILNDSPYTSQRSYNGLRLALSMAKSQPASLRIFLFGDGVIFGDSALRADSVVEAMSASTKGDITTTVRTPVDDGADYLGN